MLNEYACDTLTKQRTIYSYARTLSTYTVHTVYGECRKSLFTARTLRVIRSTLIEPLQTKYLPDSQTMKFVNPPSPLIPPSSSYSMTFGLTELSHRACTITPCRPAIPFPLWWILWCRQWYLVPLKMLVPILDGKIHWKRVDWNVI